MYNDKKDLTVADNLVQVERKGMAQFDSIPNFENSHHFTNRLLENERIKKEARNLKIKKIFTAAMSIVIAGTLAGTVIWSNKQEYEVSDTTSLEQSVGPSEEYINIQEQIQSYKEAGVTPTKEEFESGMTGEQIVDKQALDEEINQALRDRIEETNQANQQHNQDIIDNMPEYNRGMYR